MIEKYETAKKAREEWIAATHLSAVKERELEKAMDDAENDLLLAPAASGEDLALKVRFLELRQGENLAETPDGYLKAVFDDIKRLYGGGGAAPKCRQKTAEVSGALYALVDAVKTAEQSLAEQVKRDDGRQTDAMSEAQDVLLQAETAILNYPATTLADLVVKARTAEALACDSWMGQENEGTVAEWGIQAVARNLERISGIPAPAAKCDYSGLLHGVRLPVKRVAA